ncbi:unnamed protein product [Arabidopsis arenosa]|uniref:Uncharacterized protein n=1 Tax=Arabidopsis arenosa TaxID=38785 RepID=A0A8S1ZJ39_ARAAE|nr:unnamed protein product [Arabidopsis arenosa]
MSEKEARMIIEGVNCGKTRWIYRGIAMLASVVWLTRFSVELLWPSLCSSWSTWKEESWAVVLVFAAPFLHSAGLVVRSFYVPVPVPTSHNSGDWSGLVGIAMVTVCGISHYIHTIEGCIYGFSLVAGLLAAMQLSWPPKDVSVQQVVYTDFLLCLVAYLGYQRPFWLACVFVAALILVNTLLFQGLLFLHTKPPEEDTSLVSDLNV